jgi:hypothetical protein
VGLALVRFIEEILGNRTTMEAKNTWINRGETMVKNVVKRGRLCGAPRTVVGLRMARRFPE